ncbi:MAG TPA: DUF3592 domain-containing protein [Verrucomicrobiae bacterium]|nr:DUF3592 domain-containing protein [Verrucomicrobiae bacterium]
MNDALRERPKESRSGSVFLLLFGLFWCTLVGAFDFITMRSFIPQVASTWYSPALAHIFKSQVTSDRGSKGSTYGTAFEYTYIVNGTLYTGHNFGFDKTSFSDSAWAYKAVADFPARSERICYYDPKNPSRAVLSKGVRGSDLMILMFLTPFNIVGLALISYPFFAWRDRRKPELIPPRVVDRFQGREGYAMNNFSPLMTFIAAFFITSFLGIFLVVFPFGSHPRVHEVLSVWGTAFAISVAVALIIRHRMKSGRYDFVIDRASQIATIPAMHKRTSREIISLSQIKNIETAEVRSGSGDDEKKSWHVKLHTHDNREFLLRDASSEADARRLAHTLNTQIHGQVST